MVTVPGTSPEEETMTTKELGFDRAVAAYAEAVEHAEPGCVVFAQPSESLSEVSSLAGETVWLLANVNATPDDPLARVVGREDGGIVVQLNFDGLPDHVIEAA
jgi:hypothetical protein